MAINGRNYGYNGPSAPQYQSPIMSGSRTLNLGKVFGVMFLMLLATAGLAFGFGYLFYLWIINGGESAFNGVYTIFFISVFAAFGLTLAIQFFALKQGKGMLVLTILYVLCMGIMCSSLVLFLDWRILGIALGITSLIFGLLALIGLFAKNVRPMMMAGLMLIIGGSLVALITWIITLFLPSTFNVGLLWILDFAIFAGMLLLVVVDMHNIAKICEQGEVSNNLTLYCALTLYSDFIYIFIKIAYYLAIFTNNR